MQAQIKKRNSCQSVRIPEELPQDTGITLNKTLDISALDASITLTKMFRHRTLEERTAEYGGNLNLDGEYNWGTPVGREAW